MKAIFQCIQHVSKSISYLPGSVGPCEVQFFNFVSLSQLLKGVTIAAGGVLPNIHPELLAKKRGAKGKLEIPVSPAPEKKPKPVKKTASKKMSGKKAAAKAKVFPHVNRPPVR